MLITGCNEVVAKVIFLHLSVILFTGGGLPQHMLGHPLQSRHPQSRHPPWEQTPPVPTPRSRHLPWEQTPPSLSRHPWADTPPPEADSSIRSTSGRYASYWNAFLFENISWNGIFRWVTDTKEWLLNGKLFHLITHLSFNGKFRKYCLELSFLAVTVLG